MKYKTITRVVPTTEPVTIAEVKAQTRVDSTAEDTLLTAYIKAARDKVEHYCDRFFTTQQITILFYASFGTGDFSLPYADLASVESIEYTDSDNTVQTVDAAEYTFDADSQMIRLDGNWPSDAQDVRVNCTTGAPVEYEGVKQAILMIVADLYELRTENVVGTVLAPNPAVKELLRPYRDKLGVK